jgi:hypothetical protein
MRAFTRRTLLVSAPVVANVSDEQIDEDVRSLLREHIESYEHLRILLLLRSHRDRSWSAALAAERLNMAPASAEEALEHLCRRELLDRAESRMFRYCPETSEHEAAVDRLAHAYAEQQVEIMKLMSSNAVERIRTAAMRTFADAFVLGRRKRDG